MELTYCIDTSGWTRLKRGYPLSNFPSLWSRLDGLINDSRLISPDEVYRELARQSDELFNWVKSRKTIFKKMGEEHAVLVSKIQTEFPRLINPNKLGPVADPFVIALAMVRRRDLSLLGGECIVVSEEKPGTAKQTKIPNVCSQYNLKHYSVVDLICQEAWVF